MVVVVVVVLVIEKNPGPVRGMGTATLARTIIGLHGDGRGDEVLVKIVETPPEGAGWDVDH